MVCTVATRAGLKYHACVGVAMQLSMTLQRLTCLYNCAGSSSCSLITQLIYVLNIGIKMILVAS